MEKLTTIKFDGSCSMHEHVLEMTNLATKLKTLGMGLEDAFLVQLVLNSLPHEYGPFQINYNALKEKWDVNELASKLVKDETRIKNQGSHTVNLVGQGARNAGKALKVKTNKFKKGKKHVNVVQAEKKAHNEVQ